MDDLHQIIAPAAPFGGTPTPQALEASPHGWQDRKGKTVLNETTLPAGRASQFVVKYIFQ